MWSSWANFLIYDTVLFQPNAVPTGFYNSYNLFFSYQKGSKSGFGVSTSGSFFEASKPRNSTPAVASAQTIIQMFGDFP